MNYRDNLQSKIINETKFLIKHSSEFNMYISQLPKYFKGPGFLCFYPMSLTDIISAIINSQQCIRTPHLLSQIIIKKILNFEIGILTLPLNEGKMFENRYLIPSFRNIIGNWYSFIKEYHEYTPNAALLRTFRNIEELMAGDILE